MLSEFSHKRNKATDFLGVFSNPDLQALYDQLIAQGMTSQVEAYKVGVLIEEKDITDLNTAISSTTDSTIQATLKNY